LKLKDQVSLYSVILNCTEHFSAPLHSAGAVMVWFTSGKKPRS